MGKQLHPLKYLMNSLIHSKTSQILISLFAKMQNIRWNLFYVTYIFAPNNMLRKRPYIGSVVVGVIHENMITSL